MNEQIFQQANAKQNAITEKTDDFGIDCNLAPFQAAQAAFRDVMAETGLTVPHLVNSGTGTGKTTFCVALIAANGRAVRHRHGAVFPVPQQGQDRRAGGRAYDAGCV